MQPVHKFISGAVVADASLRDRQILVIASDATEDRAKDIMVPSGCQIDNYRKNNIVVADHDTTKPIGNAEITVDPDRVKALITFAPAGISAKADEYCGLAKAGVIKSVSVGFNPVEAEPRKGGGFLYKVWELLELSVLGGVPCNPNATVIARSIEALPTKADKHDYKVGASRNLPIDEDASWDGNEAKTAIFKQADFDGDKPDTTLARKGFLAYDAANPTLKGSYHLPFATVKDGRLSAVAAGVRNAASRLPQTDIPDDVAKKARAVIDHYEAKMSDKSLVPTIKNLWDVARVAEILQTLGFIRDTAAFDALVENSGSEVPKILADALRQLADAFMAMAAADIARLLSGDGALDDIIGVVDLPAIASAKTPLAKAIAITRLQVKTGRVISEENMKHLKAVQDCIGKMADCFQKAADLHDDVHDTLEEWAGHGTSAGEHVKAIVKSARGENDENENDEEDQDAREAGNSAEDADTELAAVVAQRKRTLEAMQRQAAV